MKTKQKKNEKKIWVATVSNCRPMDYETITLPTELATQHHSLLYIFHSVFISIPQPSTIFHKSQNMLWFVKNAFYVLVSNSCYIF